MKKKNGFTLIETIFYGAIITLISLFIIGSALMLVRVFGDIRLRSDINVSVRTALERIVREIRSAESIGAESVFDFHPGRLKLNIVDADDNPGTVEFFVEGDNLVIRENAFSPEKLTSANVRVISLVFRQISTPVSKAVRVELEISGLSFREQKTEKFYDTAILRKSHQ